MKIKRNLLMFLTGVIFFGAIGLATMTINSNSIVSTDGTLRLTSNGTTHTGLFFYKGIDEDTVALSVISGNPYQSAFWLTGNETDHGTLKIAHNPPIPLDDSGAAALSIDLRGNLGETAAQGIYIEMRNSSGKAIHVSSNSSVSPFTVNYDGRTIITSDNPEAFLVQDTGGNDIFRCNVPSGFCFTTKIIPNTLDSYDIGDNTKRYRNITVKAINNVTQITGFPNIDIIGNITLKKLNGTGNALLCVDSGGVIYRGNTTGCP